MDKKDKKDAMSMVPKQEALKDIINTMKSMKLEKMKGYSKADDEEPAMEVEMHKVSKDKAKALKDKLKSMMSDKEED